MNRADATELVALAASLFPGRVPVNAGPWVEVVCKLSCERARGERELHRLAQTTTSRQFDLSTLCGALRRERSQQQPEERRHAPRPSRAEKRQNVLAAACLYLDVRYAWRHYREEFSDARCEAMFQSFKHQYTPAQLVDMAHEKATKLGERLEDLTTILVAQSGLRFDEVVQHEGEESA